MQLTGWRGALAGLSISLVTVSVGLTVAELVLRHVWKDPYQWDHRLMFYSEGVNFRNTSWGGFTYQPNSDVRVATYYLTDLNGPKFVKEYEYTLHSDAYGLVERQEPDTSKPVLLVLGDSYTEGQGAEPWFYSLHDDWPAASPYEVVNGGLIATGVQSWGLLYRQLASKMRIRKLLVLFISEDWTRPVWRFSPQTINCLTHGSLCKGDENFYGLPADSGSAAAQIQRIARLRASLLKRVQHQQPLLERSALYHKLLAPAYRGLRGYLQSGRVGSHRLEQFELSKPMALTLMRQLGPDNLLFMHLPQKDEVASGPSWIGRRVDNFLGQHGFAPVDGFKTCGLVIGDFHEHDGHPNADGYAKIEKCVEKAMRDAQLR